MGKNCLRPYLTYPECCLTPNIVSLSQFSNLPNLGLKCHLPRLQSPVWGGGAGQGKNLATQQVLRSEHEKLHAEE